MAELLGITPVQYRKKERGEVQFKLNEMLKKLVNILAKRWTIFFTIKAPKWCVRR